MRFLELIERTRNLVPTKERLVKKRRWHSAAGRRRRPTTDPLNVGYGSNSSSGGESAKLIPATPALPEKRERIRELATTVYNSSLDKGRLIEGLQESLRRVQVSVSVQNWRHRLSTADITSWTTQYLQGKSTRSLFKLGKP
jgi:hypothetical protein